MFTVKHIDQHGNETMVECARFIREQRSDPFVQYTAHREPTAPDNYSYIATWCGDERAETLQSVQLGRQAIYVMNRFGATVANYTFAAPNFAGCNADPERLAA